MCAGSGEDSADARRTSHSQKGSTFVGGNPHEWLTAMSKSFMNESPSSCRHVFLYVGMWPAVGGGKKPGQACGQLCQAGLWQGFADKESSVSQFPSHSEDLGQREPGASRWETQPCDSSLAESDPLSTEAERSEGLLGLNQGKRVPVDTDGWRRWDGGLAALPPSWDECLPCGHLNCYPLRPCPLPGQSADTAAVL